MNIKKALNNNWLTQAILNENEERTFVKEVSGFGNLEELFIEWSDNEKTQWELEHSIEDIYQQPLEEGKL